MKKHYRHENDCLNCGAELQGKFCHNCGQENLQINEGFGHMMTHAVSDYFHFDHQFFHTLKPLFFKPGYLTTEYMAGRRVQYLHPVKMYIFISVVFFLLYFKDSTKFVEVKQTPVKNAYHQVADSLKAADSAIVKDKNLSSVQKTKLQHVVGKLKKHGVTVNFKRPGEDEDGDPKNGFNAIFKISKGEDTTYAQYMAKQSKLAPNDRDGFIERAWFKKKYDYNAKYGNRAGEVFFDEFKHNVPKMMFILLPIFALILRVTFWKNKKFYVEHLIYSFHLHCFLFLFLAIIMLIESAFPVKWVSDSLGLISFIIIVWYVYTSLRLIYQRSRFRTITKMIGMYLMYLLSISVCVSLVVLITAMMAG